MTIKRFAIIDNTAVTNIILLDESDEYVPDAGQLLIPTTDEVTIGWQWVNNAWIAPAALADQPSPTEDPDVTQAKMDGLQELKDVGISEATARRILGLPIET